MSKLNEPKSGRWTAQEHHKYLIAMQNNFDWKKTAEYVATRTAAQCRSHHQKVTLKNKKSYSLTASKHSSKVDKAVQYEPQIILMAMSAVKLIDTLPTDLESTSSDTFSSCIYESEALPSMIIDF